MGGKKEKESQRTKGNTKPSSSARSAQLLASSGKSSGFIGFGGLAATAGPDTASVSGSSTAPPAFVPLSGLIDPFAMDGDDADVPAEIRVVLRKMGKKDAVTKLKAVQEFSEMLKEIPETTCTKIARFWTRIYVKLALDHDRRVREASHKALAIIVEKIGRNIAPHLKSLLPVWFACQHEPHPPAASAAIFAFAKAFPVDTKAKEAILFASEEILIFVEDNLHQQTPQTLSDPKTTSPEDMESKYVRIVSMSLLAFAKVLSTLAEDQKRFTKVEALLSKIVLHPNWMKLGNSKNILVKSAWFQALASVCHTYPAHFFKENTDLTQKTFKSVVNHVDSKEVNVSLGAWDSALVLARRSKEFELDDKISVSEVLLPKIEKSIGKDLKDTDEQIYPKLLPLMAQFPNEVIVDHTASLMTSLANALFTLNEYRALTVGRAGISVAKMKSAARAFGEMAALFFIKHNPDEDAAARDKVTTQVVTAFSAVLDEDVVLGVSEVFVDQISNLLTTLNNKEALRPLRQPFVAALIGKMKHFYDSKCNNDPPTGLNRLAVILAQFQRSSNTLMPGARLKKRKGLTFEESRTTCNEASESVSVENDLIYTELVEPVCLDLTSKSLGPSWNLAFAGKILSSVSLSKSFYSKLARKLGVQSSANGADREITSFLQFIWQRQMSHQDRDQKKKDFVNLCIKIASTVEHTTERLKCYEMLLDDFVLGGYVTEEFLNKIADIKNKDDAVKMLLAGEKFGKTLVQYSNDLCSKIINVMKIANQGIPDDTSNLESRHWELLAAAFQNVEFISERNLEEILSVFASTTRSISQRFLDQTTRATTDGDSKTLSLGQQKTKAIVFLCDILATLQRCHRLFTEVEVARDLVLGLLAVDVSAETNGLDLQSRSRLRSVWTTGLKRLTENSEGTKSADLLTKASGIIRNRLSQGNSSVSLAEVDGLTDIAMAILECQHEDDNDLLARVRLSLMAKMIPAASELTQMMSQAIKAESAVFEQEVERNGLKLALLSREQIEPQDVSPIDPLTILAPAKFIKRVLNLITNPSRGCKEGSLHDEIADVSASRSNQPGKLITWAQVNQGDLPEILLHYFAAHSFAQIITKVRKFRCRRQEVLSEFSLSDFTSGFDLQCNRMFLSMAQKKSREAGNFWSKCLHDLLKFFAHKENDFSVDIQKMIPEAEESVAFVHTMQVLVTVGSVEECLNVLSTESAKLLSLTEPDAHCFLTSSSLALATAGLNRLLTLQVEPLNEVQEAVHNVLAAITAMKSALKEDGFLFSRTLTWDSVDQVLFVNNLSAALTSILRLDYIALTPEQWDMILCSVSAWVQSFQITQRNKDERSKRKQKLITLFSQPVFHLTARVSKLIQTAKTSLSSQSDLVKSIPSNVLDEWQEFFATDIFSELLICFVKFATSSNDIEDSDVLLRSIGAVLIQIPDDQLFAHKLEPKFLVDDVDCLTNYSDHLVFLLNHLAPLLTSEIMPVQRTVYHLLNRVMDKVVLEEEEMEAQSSGKSVSVDASGKEESIAKEPPRRLSELLDKTQLVTSSVFGSDGEFEFGEFLPLPPENTAHTYTMAYLLTWKLILQFVSGSKAELRPKISEHIREKGLLDTLMPVLFHLMPKNYKYTLEEPELSPDEFESLEDEQEVISDVNRVAVSIYCALLMHLPAMVRQWWNNREKKVSDIIERFTSNHITPLLWAAEVEAINNSVTEFENMSVKVRVSVREVVAVYTVDESSMELVIQVPPNFPLGQVKVDSGRRVGVEHAQWRKWMLQLTTFLQHQNGSIMDGLTIWKRNVDKRFEGVEECYICFYVLHGANHQLPQLACRTCKKKFHSACLYKWFSTSNNSTCPLCRNLF